MKRNRRASHCIPVTAVYQLLKASCGDKDPSKSKRKKKFPVEIAATQSEREGQPGALIRGKLEI